MGELVDFIQYKKKILLKSWLNKSQSKLNEEIPPLVEWGWEAYKEDTLINQKYDAIIGEQEEFAFLIRDNKCFYYQMSIGELALGLEFGTLSEPSYIHDYSKSKDSVSVSS